ncbi:ATP-dependent RNA helicase [Entophlyctis luteolus]|nr:ATP-dependent RNA helicase [Entophlyctis luteolus]
MKSKKRNPSFRPIPDPPQPLKEFEFSEDPKDWIPSDDSDGSEASEDDSATQRITEISRSEFVPASKLKWREVSTFGNDVGFLSGSAEDVEGFLCLEELDGVDVELVHGPSGAKTINFKEVRSFPSKPGKPAEPETPFPEKETTAKFIHIDEFDEEQVTAKDVKRTKDETAMNNSTLDGQKSKSVAETGKSVKAIAADEKIAALGSNADEKPLNKRERAALKRAKAAGQIASTDQSKNEAGPDLTARGLFNSPHANHISAEVRSSWAKFRLSPSILRALSDLNFTAPTDIQVKALSAALDITRKGNGSPSGRDVIGAAATGSGKTLSFGLPVVQMIARRDEKEGIVIDSKDEDKDGAESDDKPEKPKQDRSSRPPTALIMTPTRELAMQVTDHLKSAAKYTTAKVISIVGGLSLQKQRRQLSQYPDIIVATPGRLWELAEEDENFRSTLKCVKFLILDEADRMLEQGHFRDLENILNAVSLTRRDDSTPAAPFEVPANRQTFVFSATLIDDPSSLSKKFVSKSEKAPKGSGPAKTLKEFLSRLEFNAHKEGPVHIQALTTTLMASGLTEARIEVLDEDKDAATYYILTKYPNGRSIVFVNSIDMVRRLVPVFKLCGINAVGLHSEMQQRQRLNYLDRFRTTDSCVLFATDVAARGLDIPLVEHVIHFHLPRTADWYVHRSGRTARGSNEGMSIALVGPSEVEVYKKICHTLRKDNGLLEFPVDHSIMNALKTRIALAKKVEAAEHKVAKEKHDQDWLRKAAVEAEILLDDSGEDEEATHNAKRRKTQRTDKGKDLTAQQLKSMKIQLAELLQKPLLPAGVSATYITSNADRNFASAVLKSENSDAAKIIKGNTSKRAVDDVKVKKSRGLRMDP